MKLSIRKSNFDPEIDNKISGINILWNKSGKIFGYGIYDNNLKNIEGKYKCKCGKISDQPFHCDECDSDAKEVFSYFESPIKFYPFYETTIPKNKHKDIIQSLLKYETYLDENNVIHKVEDLTNEDLTEFLSSKITYGIDAVRQFTSDEEFENIKNSLVDKIGVIKYALRVPVIQDNKVIVGDLNLYYCDIYSKLEDYSKILEVISNDNTKLLVSYKLYKDIDHFYDNLKNLLFKGKSGTLKKDVYTQKIGGAIRAVIVPTPDIKEDEVLFPTIFANVLFPQFKGLWNNAKELNELMSYGHFNISEWLYECKTDDSNDKLKIIYPWDKDFDLDNLCVYKKHTKEYFINYIKNNGNRKPWYVLVNRPPTISQLSFLALKPVFIDSIGCNEYAKNIGSDKIISKSLSKEKDINWNDEIVNVISDNTLDSKKQDSYDIMVAGLNPIFGRGLNFDFDGDSLFFMSVWNKNVDCSVMLPSKNYITISDGELRNGLEDMHLNALSYFYKYDKNNAQKIHEYLLSLVKD